MNKILRNVLIALVAITALVLALPFIVPLESYRGPIENAATTATGRSFKIDGPIRLTFFPHFGVKAQEVTLANVPGGRASVMVEVGDIDLSVKVLPLLTGRIALDKIVLNQPTIALEIDRTGNPNWKFGKETADATGAKKKGSLTLPAGTEFSGIEVTDGRVTYDNDKTNTHRALEHVNLSIGITTADQPLTATGTMMLSERQISIAARLATLQTFLGSGTTEFEMSADADLLHAALKGTLQPDGTTRGAIKLNTKSFRDLIAWLSSPLPSGGFHDLTLTSRITNKDKVTRFDDLVVTLDRQTMKGNLAVDARSKVPSLEGSLAIDRLDLNPYLSGGKNGGRAEPALPGWSRTPFSVAILKAFNAKLSLSTGALAVRNIRLGRTALRLDNQNGLLTAWMDQVTLYGGGGKALFVADARGSVPRFHNTVDIKGVQLRPLLKDALNLDTLEGTGALNLDIAMAGNNPNAILHSLTGKGAIAGTNGRFRGVDLGAVAKSVKTILGSDATGDVAGTDFHAMGASFALVNGVMETQDFRMNGPVVTMTGQGAIDIGGRNIDFRLKPAAGMAGFSISVPFRITGSWDKLHYGPDLDAMVGGMMDSLKNGGAAVDRLLRGNPQDQPKDGKKKTMGDQFKNLLGIH